MRRLFLTLGVLLALSSSAFAQASVVVYCVVTGTTGPVRYTPCSATYPLPVSATVSASVAVAPLTTTQTKVTIAVTNTYQQALALNAARQGCLLQNEGANTVYVFFGSAPADTTTSFQLATKQGISCAVGGLGVATDAIQVTGTANDVVVVSSQ